jgi:hemerythrin
VASLTWSESYAVGHKVLDAEHRHLVELINEVSEAVQSRASREQVASLLRVLRGVAVEHIRQENSVLWELKSGNYEPLRGRPQTPHFLKAMADAAFDEHMAEHATLMESFDAIGSAPLDMLCETLGVWFLDHAVKHDARLKAIFQAAA